MQTYAIPMTAAFLDRTEREYPLLIRDLPAEEKPREKLIAQGPEALTVRELMAVVLATGTVREDVLGMSDRIIRDYGERSILAERDPSKLSREMDLPIVKACQIVAVGELGRRFYDRGQSGFAVIRTARDVYEYLADMRNLPKEHLRGLYLNAHNRVIRDEVISIGTVDANIIHARDVFRPAIECNAAAVILAHNHPSGQREASAPDIEATSRIIEAGKLIGIRLLDHVIITKDAFASVTANY